jgi:hypothetical protein
VAGIINQIREALTACFGAHSKPLTKAEVFSWIDENYSTYEFNPNTLQAQLYRSCVNVKSALGSSAPKILFYEKTNKTYRIASVEEQEEFKKLQMHSSDANEEELGANEGAEPELESTFALEAHLRDYLARNLAALEKGLVLWSENPRSVEFSLEGRRIDILAKDAESIPVVIELKLSKGHEKTLGQALYYRAKLKQQLDSQKIRIMLVAGEITDELRIASTEVSDVDLFSYTLTMQVQKLN